MWFGGSLVVTRADGAMTGGGVAVFDFIAGERPYAPRHRVAHDQVFLLLDGEMELALGDERVTLMATSSVVIPASTTFAHRVSSPTARYLLIGAPAGIEPLFRIAGVPAGVRQFPPPTAPPPDGEVLSRAAAAAGVEIVGPPPE